MITTIIFDIGGVFFHQPDAATQDFRAELGLVDQSLVDQTMFKSDIWDQYKRGGMPEADYWNHLISELPAGYTEGWEALSRLFDQAVQLDTELLTIARELKKTYKVHALSNAGVELERRLQHFGMRHLFDEVINSHYVKMAKPDPEIYRYTSKLVGAEPEEILFVDDKSRNTVIADDMGWNTHIYKDSQTFYRYLMDTGLLSDGTELVGRE